MSEPSASGALGHVQLLGFVNAASIAAVSDAAMALGFTQTHSEPGTVLSATDYLKVHASPEYLLVEILNADDAPAQLDALADVVNPHTKVIVCGAIDSVRLYHWLMDLGIHDYLLTPFTAIQLAEAITKSGDKKTPAEISGSPETRKMIAVIGARGGAGATTIAVNLAAMLAQTHHQPTALIDLDPHFGNVSLSLDLEVVRGLRDALEKPDRVDSLFLERVMVKPFASLSILSAEEPLSELVTPHASAGELLFPALHEKFPFAVVDLPRQMNAMARYVLSKADHVIVVSEPQLGALRDALRLKDYLVDFLKRPAPWLLLNKVGLAPKHELPVKEFTKHYGSAAKLQLAHTSDIVAAGAEGALLVGNDKLRQPLAPLYHLAQKIVGSDAGEVKGKAVPLPFLARLKGKY